MHDEAPAHTADQDGHLDTPGQEDLLACMDQTMLAEAHAAMMTIENAGAPLALCSAPVPDSASFLHEDR